MVTLEEIQKQTGVSINIFQYWRRKQNEGLLPEPVAVRKKVIYFEDSIIERIRFIKARLDEGLKLADIKELLQQKDEEEMAANYDPYETFHNPADVRIDAVAKLEEKWTAGNRKNDICLALALDPAIAGQPSLSVHCDGWSVEVYASIVSNGWVHFVRLAVDVASETDITVCASAKIAVSDYGMLLAIMGQKFAEDGLFLNPGDIPAILFGSKEQVDWSGVFSLETLEEAKKLTRVLRAGQEFIKRL